ncbi:Dabb family protein [Agromyces indicus]|uniref:Dabb family protein n=1 Tax=Agromyces indicus TaxID=758919 RepID=A0ABU1FIF8_9MICO|nr:Dabb family protein [Agromyces indicus]MDR5691538.1 Dabb family protein [Agromyces indicus]
MIRHIVLFKLTDRSPHGAAEQVETLRSALEPLAASVPGVLGLRVSADTTSIATHWDAALETEHASWEDLAAYQAHPEHRRAVEAIDPVVTERAVVDYEVT